MQRKQNLWTLLEKGQDLNGDHHTTTEIISTFGNTCASDDLQRAAKISLEITKGRIDTPLGASIQEGL